VLVEYSKLSKLSARCAPFEGSPHLHVKISTSDYLNSSFVTGRKSDATEFVHVFFQCRY